MLRRMTTMAAVALALSAAQFATAGQIGWWAFDEGSGTTAKDGSGKRYVTEVVASDVIFLGSKRQDESAGTLEDEGFGGSVRKDRRLAAATYDDFPMDISSVQDDDEEADIPF